MGLANFKCYFYRWIWCYFYRWIWKYLNIVLYMIEKPWRTSVRPSRFTNYILRAKEVFGTCIAGNGCEMHAAAPFEQDRQPALKCFDCLVGLANFKCYFYRWIWKCLNIFLYIIEKSWRTSLISYRFDELRFPCRCFAPELPSEDRAPKFYSIKSIFPS